MNAPVRLIICKNCGEEVPRRGAVQKYCVPCSEAKRKERGAEWARNNPPDDENRRRWDANSKRRARQNGLILNAAASRKSLVDGERHEYDAGWVVKFTIPFSFAASKNHIWSLGGKTGHVFKRQASREYQDALALRVKSALRGKTVCQNKIWIDLFVQKPNHKGDAINVVDVVCDAIKVGVGIDDRWFCIRQLDWEITKNDPQIYIAVSQRDNFDAQACSCCGRILPLTAFNKSKHGRMGVGRECKECTSKKPVGRAA